MYSRVSWFARFSKHLSYSSSIMLKSHEETVHCSGIWATSQIARGLQNLSESLSHSLGRSAQYSTAIHPGCNPPGCSMRKQSLSLCWNRTPWISLNWCIKSFPWTVPMEKLIKANTFFLIPLKLHLQVCEMENEHWEVTLEKTVVCCEPTFLFSFFRDIPLCLVMSLSPGLALTASLQLSDFPGDTCGRVFVIWDPGGHFKTYETAVNREP